MALFPLIPKIQITVEDAKGFTSTVSFPMQRIDPAESADPLTPQTYEEAVKNFVERLDDIIGGRIVNCSVNLPIDISTVSGLDTMPDTLSDVEELGVFSFRTENGYKTEFKIPTFSENHIAEAGDAVDVDLTDLDVIDFVNIMLQGPDSSAAVTEERKRITDGRGDVLTELSAAYGDFRQSSAKKRAEKHQITSL